MMNVYEYRAWSFGCFEVEGLHPGNGTNRRFELVRSTSWGGKGP